MWSRGALMAGPVEEELGALAAIFCGPGEWEVLSRSGDRPPRARGPARDGGVTRSGSRSRGGWGGRPQLGAVPEHAQCHATARAAAGSRGPEAKARAPPSGGPVPPPPAFPRACRLPARPRCGPRARPVLPPTRGVLGPCGRGAGSWSALPGAVRPPSGVGLKKLEGRVRFAVTKLRVPRTVPGAQ